MIRNVKTPGKTLRLMRACLAAFALSVAIPAHSYEVSPMRMVLQPERGQNSGTISVNNIRDEDLLIEIQVFRRILSENGEQTLEPADDEFLVFPPQMRIAPGGSQSIRFQYLGALAGVSEAFVVQVTEVPVNRVEQTGIQMVYNFGVAVYLRPNRARSRLEASEGSIRNGRLRFTMTNEGNDYGFVLGQALEYRVGDEQRTIAPEQLTELIALPLFAPDSRRIVELPIEGAADADKVSVRLVGQAAL